MKPDELRLLKAFQQCHTVGVPLRLTFRELAQSLGVNQKRAAYIAQKWTDRGWYNYGVDVLLGWLEPDGLKVCPIPAPYNPLSEITEKQMEYILNQRSAHADLLRLVLTGAKNVDETQTSQGRSERAEAGATNGSTNQSTP